MESSILPVYSWSGLDFDRGEGVWLITTDGRRYLDFGAGVAVASLGYSHPHLVQALTAQVQKLWHTSNLHLPPGGERLARRLVGASFADMAFFTNSGAEANEAAIKIARRYHASRGQDERYRIITIEGAFHGRTLATLAAGGQQKYLQGFGPKTDGFDQVPFGDAAAMSAAIGPNTAAIMIEPIQGEGGIRAVDGKLQRAYRDLCDENGLLLIMDEVQCGMGRTGTLFAHQLHGVTPDVMSLAKGIGGGFPMGACLVTRRAGAGMTRGSHATTFGGNPLAMAAGNAVLDILLDTDLMSSVRVCGQKLREGLEAMARRYPQVISGVRGEGLMLGLKMNIPNDVFVTAARKRQLLLISSGENTVRVLPPLIVTPAEISEACERMSAVCEGVVEHGLGG